MTSPSGIVLLNKPLHDSSRYCVNKVARLYNTKKAGHGGTLDPLATGMLVVCLNEATKANTYLLSAQKAYRAHVQLGERRVTGDSESPILQYTKPPTLSRLQLETLLQPFRGTIQQKAPRYSALKHNGKPLYQYAREGIEIPRKTRTVHIESLELLNYSDNCLHLNIICSKGTYIRSLAEDIGEAVGCGACLRSLHRLWSSPFENHRQWELSELHDAYNRQQAMLPISAAFPSTQQLDLDEQQAGFFYHGKAQPVEQPDANLILVYHQNQLLGFGMIKDAYLSVKRRLNLWSPSHQVS